MLICPSTPPDHYSSLDFFRFVHRKHVRSLSHFLEIMNDDYCLICVLHRYFVEKPLPLYPLRGHVGFDVNSFFFLTITTSSLSFSRITILYPAPFFQLHLIVCFLICFSKTQLILRCCHWYDLFSTLRYHLEKKFSSSETGGSSNECQNLLSSWWRKTAILSFTAMCPENISNWSTTFSTKEDKRWNGSFILVPFCNFNPSPLSITVKGDKFTFKRFCILQLICCFDDLMKVIKIMLNNLQGFAASWCRFWHRGQTQPCFQFLSLLVDLPSSCPTDD